MPMRIQQDTTVFKGLGWVLVAEYPAKEIFEPVSRLRRMLLIGLFIFAIFAVILGLYISYKVAVPINKLKNATCEISKGKLDMKIDIDSKDEIGELAASFNLMAKDLKDTMVSKAYIDNIFASMLDSLLVIDADEKIITVNQATCDLFSYKEEELIGEDVAILFSDEDMNLKSKGTHCDKIQGIVIVAKDITERKKAEEAINESEARFRGLYENMGSGIAVYEAINNGEDFIFKDLNRVGAKISNIKKEDAIGKRVTVVFPGIKDFGLFDVFVNVWKTGKAQFLPVSFYKDHMLANWYENYVYKLPSGEIIAIYDDVSDKKKTETDLMESSNLLKEAQSIAKLGHFNMNIEFGIVCGSEELFNIFDLSTDKNKFEDFVEKLHPEDKDIVVNTIKNAISNNETYEIEHRLICGDIEKWVYAIGRKKNKFSLIGTVQDITKRKESEKDLMLFKNLINNSNDSIFVINTENGKFLDVNNRSVESLGYSRDELLNMKVIDLEVVIPDNFSWNNHIKKARKNKFMVLEGLHKRKDNTFFPVEISLRILFHAGKEYMLAIARDITERKKAENELAVSNLKRRALMENVPGMFYSGAPDWSAEIFSGSENICGYTAEEINSKDEGWLSLVHNDDKETVIKKGSNFAAIQENTTQIYRINNKDGRIVWVEDHKSPILSDNGEYAGVDGVVFNITDIKKATMEITEKNERFNRLAERSRTISWEVDHNGLYTYMNHVAKSVLGYDPEEIINTKYFYDLHPEENREEFKKAAFKIFEQKEIFNDLENALETKDGNVKWVLTNGSPIINADDQLIGYRGEDRDITDRKKAAEEIVSIAKFPSENPNPIIRATKDGEIIYTNKGSDVLLDFCGCKLRDYMNEDWKNNIKAAFKDGKSRIFHINACGLMLEFTITPVQNMDYVNIYGRDITEQIRSAEEKNVLQAQLFQSQKMDAVGTIASGIAHNFNNILASILGNAEMIINEISPDNRSYEDLQSIINGIESAKQLTSEMLLFSRIHVQNIKQMEISSTVLAAINMFRASLKGVINIHDNINPDCGFVLIDPNQFKHVILNILTNSAYAIEGLADSINVDLSKIIVDADFTLKYSNLKEGEYVKLDIKDAGKGMDQKTVARIFEPFFTTKDVGQGTGLGLSVAHGIITGCGGEITVDSELGKGTTFSIYLPIINS